MPASHAGEIREADAHDVEGLTEMLVDAFRDDPFFRWLVPLGSTHERRLSHLFTWFLRRALENGTILVAERLSGAVLIMPPDRWKLGIRQQLAEVRLGIQAFGLARLIPRVVQIDALERRAPPDEHFYIPLLATSPDMRGQGIGSSLLQRALGLSDAAKSPTYLENTSEANIDFYRHFGFEVLEVFDIARKAPPMWLMIRKPGAEMTAASLKKL